MTCLIYYWGLLAISSPKIASVLVIQHIDAILGDLFVTNFYILDKFTVHTGAHSISVRVARLRSWISRSRAGI